MNEKLETRFGVLSGFWLKMIAIVTMLIDHLGATLFQNQIWMRYVGRIAFPIFCFLIVEGFVHTKDVKKYSIRLFIFAIISELAFDFAFYGKLFYWEHQNVFFTLLFGLLCLIAIERNTKTSLQVICVISAMLLAWVFCTDYGGAGVLLIVCFYLFRDNKLKILIALFLINSILLTRFFTIEYLWETNRLFKIFIQDFAILSILPIGLYNGKRGINMKWFFYLFYPLHLLIIYLISYFI